LLTASSYPEEWSAEYEKMERHLIDPIVRMALKRVSPFKWEDDIALLAELQCSKIFSCSGRGEIVNGVTFVLHDGMYNISLLSILFERNFQAELEGKVMSNRCCLQMLLIDIDEHVKRIAQSKNLRSNLLEDKGFYLTPREEEVLYWAGMGKTYAEISIIANIAVRTVKFHMGNVVEKLGVVNSRQAIRLSSELNLVAHYKNR